MKKRVVLVGATPPPHHGMTIFMENLLRSELVNRYDVLRVDTSDHRNLDNLGKFDFWNVYYALRNLWEAFWLCVVYKPALVYVPLAQNIASLLRDGLIITVASWFSPAKILVHYHGGESFNHFRSSVPWFFKVFIGYVLHRVDVAIVLGEGLKPLFRSSAKRVEVVANGTNFLCEKRDKKTQDDGCVTVAYLGTLMRAKGVLDLIHAANGVVKKCRSVRFRFAGEWWSQESQTRNEVEMLVHTCDLSGAVSFEGKILGEAKERYLLGTDIFVLPSWSEGFPMVILEAMAAACPVISTKVGAIPEVVVDGVTGILVEKQNPEQLADAIMRLIEDPELRLRMGQAGRKRFEEYYTFEKCAERLIKVFEAALHERNS